MAAIKNIGRKGQVVGLLATVGAASMAGSLAGAQPAAAAERCTPELGHTVRKGSSVFNTTLFRWTHVMGVCTEGGKIKRVWSDRTYAWDLDQIWNYEGLRHHQKVMSPDRKNYRSDAGATFRGACIPAVNVCDRAHPHVNLRADGNGGVWITGSSSG